MPAAYVGARGTATGGSGPGQTIAVTALTTPGNTLVVYGFIRSTTLALVVTDSRSNAWTTQITATSANGRAFVATAVNHATPLNPATSDTITCSVGAGGVLGRSWAAHEFSGVAAAGPVDRSSTGVGAGTSPSSGSTAATTQAEELLLGVIGTDGVSGDTYTNTAAMTALARVVNASGSASVLYPSYRVVAAAGAYAESATITSRTWAAGILTLKAAVAAPSAVRRVAPQVIV